MKKGVKAGMCGLLLLFGAVFQSPAATEEQQADVSAIQVFFVVPNPPPSEAGNGQGPVTLVALSDPKGWPSSVEVEGQIEVLLRMPGGVQLQSKDWQPVELPPEEKNDPAQWALFRWEQPLLVPIGEHPQPLMQMSVPLAVVEEGVNWVITARVRIIPNEKAIPVSANNLQGFGAVFATLRKGVAEFHLTPRSIFSELEGPLEGSDAQTD